MPVDEISHGYVLAALQLKMIHATENIRKIEQKKNNKVKLLLLSDKSKQKTYCFTGVLSVREFWYCSSNHFDRKWPLSPM